MSSPTAVEDAQLIAIAAALAPSNYIVVAISALLVYEWVIGFGKEVNLFWKEKVTAATVLFLLNRYAPLVYFLSSFAGNSAHTDKRYPSRRSIFRINAKSVFSALRTYALCGKRWTLAIPVLVLSLVPLGIDLTRLYWSHGEMVPIWGCDTITVVPDNINLMFFYPSLGRDGLIELYRSASFHTTSFIINRRGRNCAQRMLINGTIYFVILLVLNILHLTFTLLSIATDGGFDSTSYVISFSEPITAILVSRFMFDLQKAKQKSQHRSDAAIGTGFDRALGSIGSTLSPSDVWRAGPGPAASDFHREYAEGRPDLEDEDVFMKFEPDVFGKGAVTSVILEVDSTPSLRGRRVSERV
ncbi:hypothetical protein GSI_03575 [Ganoderma sinense ZZ0214-1]|uniref:DUF6533 domain-containing protein n=1 Tax=Ganoderma sinense ZZ0214-1 TaxID=1077348 RepID=A0A2G8SJC3_9APHY|nr:hypothetical protein GSI_03575 [Ganoderma sinense ZZ0214-1]